MTNEEKYLKDGVDVKELSRELCEYIKEYYGLIMGNVHGLAGFWLMPCKPALTEQDKIDEYFERKNKNDFKDNNKAEEKSKERE